MGRTSYADSEDVSQGAILMVLERGHGGWDPVTQPDLFLHLAGLARRLAAKLRSERRRHGQVGMNITALELAATEAEYTAPSAEELYITEQRKRRGMQAVRELVAKDTNPLTTKVLDLLEQEVDTMRDQAAALGVTMMEVRNARQRIARYLAKVEAQLDAGDPQ
jgi:hypothetical protein